MHCSAVDSPGRNGAAQGGLPCGCKGCLLAARVACEQPRARRDPGGCQGGAARHR